MDSNWLAILTYKYNNNSQLSYLQLSVYMKTKVNKVKHRALSACRVLQDPLRTTNRNKSAHDMLLSSTPYEYCLRSPEMIF